MAVFEGKMSPKDIIINDKISFDIVVVSYVPRGTCSSLVNDGRTDGRTHSSKNGLTNDEAPKNYSASKNDGVVNEDSAYRFSFAI